MSVDTVRAINDIIMEGLDISLGDMEAIREDVRGLRNAVSDREVMLGVRDARIGELERANNVLGETLARQAREITELKEERLAMIEDAAGADI